MQDKFDTLILDLDGTVYIDAKPIKNIIAQLNSFSTKKGKKVYYLTNNTSVNKETYLRKLQKLGLETSIDSIITPTIVAATYLVNNVSNKGFVVGTESLITELKEYGITNTYENADFVLVGFDRELTYDKIMKAAILINSGIPYYITHIDDKCPTEFGPIPDCGSFAKMLESTTGKKFVTHFGKPSKLIAEYLDSIIKGLDKKRVLFAGDRLYTDIALGNEIGIETLLVLSGESTQEDYEKNTKYKVSFCSETLSDFLG